jgi:hypothetical protein
MMMEIKILAWDRHKDVMGLNPTLLITGSPMAVHTMYISK